MPAPGLLLGRCSSLISIAGLRSACADPVSELLVLNSTKSISRNCERRENGARPADRNRVFSPSRVATSRRAACAQMEALRGNPANYRELKVFLHSDLSSNPGRLILRN